MQSSHRIILILLMAGAVCWLALPGSEHRYIVCPLHRLTGWNCPLCGGQRLVHELLHGRLCAAFFHNPLLFMSLPLVVLWIFRQCFPCLSRRYPRLTGECLFSSRACLCYLLLALGWGVVRNL